MGASWIEGEAVTWLKLRGEQCQSHAPKMKNEQMEAIHGAFFGGNLCLECKSLQLMDKMCTANHISPFCYFSQIRLIIQRA